MADYLLFDALVDRFANNYTKLTQNIFSSVHGKKRSRSGLRRGFLPLANFKWADFVTVKPKG